MAKVTGPLMSLTASGKLGKSIVFMTWRGIQDVRKWLKPANPRTDAQMDVREDFSNAVTKYHSLTGTDMEALRLKCQSKPYSGFNLWIGWIRRLLKQNKTWVTISNVGSSNITSSGAKISATPDAAGVLRVYVGTTAGSWTKSFDEDAPGANANTPHEITLTDLTSGTKYWYTVEYPEASSKLGYTGWYTFTTS